MPSGAGRSESYDVLQDQEGRGHWYNLTDKEINPEGKYDQLQLSTMWKQAIAEPGVMKEHDDIRRGMLYHHEYALFDPERKQILSGLYECPSRSGHHLYQTCWRCGQYG